MKTELTKRDETRAEPVENQRWFEPQVDVFENTDEWLVQADVPGVNEDGLRVHLDKNELLIEARRAEDVKHGFPFAGYRRAFTLPSGVDAQKVTAELDRGIVAVHLPKAASIKPRRILIGQG